MNTNDLPSEVRAQCMKLCGLLNMPLLDEFGSVEHFLSEILNRTSQARSLILQASRNLGSI